MLFKKLSKQIDELNKAMQMANISEIVYILGSKKKMFFRNVWAGIGRGIRNWYRCYYYYCYYYLYTTKNCNA